MNAAALLPALRNDLQLSEAAAGRDGAPQWTLSDPLTGRYFKLSPTAIRLLRHWALRDPKRVLDAANAEPGLPVLGKELEQLLMFLRGHDLIAASDAEQRKSYVGKARARQNSLWKSVLHQYLFFPHPAVATRPLSQPQLALAAAPWSPAAGDRLTTGTDHRSVSGES